MNDGIMTIYLNAQPLEIEKQQLAEILMQCVPCYMLDSSMPAPTTKEDLIRGFIKMGWLKVCKDAMMSVYGSVPNFSRREDRLPYLWPTAITYIINTFSKQEIRLYAETNTQGGAQRIYKIDAYPAPTTGSTSPSEKVS